MKARFVALLVPFAIGCESAWSQTLDQQFVPTGSTIAYVYDGYSPILDAYFNVDWSQTFTVGMAGALTDVELRAFRAFDGVTEPLLFDIRTTSGGVPTDSNVGANILYSLSINSGAIGTNESAPLHINLGPGAVPVSVGDVLALTLRSNDRLLGAYRWDGTSSASYAGGRAFTRVSASWEAQNSGATDLGFRTYVSIPEPTTLALVGLGSLALMMSRRALSRY